MRIGSSKPSCCVARVIHAVGHRADRSCASPLSERRADLRAERRRGRCRAAAAAGAPPASCTPRPAPRCRPASCSGTRTFCPIMSNSVWSGLPPLDQLQRAGSAALPRRSRARRRCGAARRCRACARPPRRRRRVLPLWKIGIAMFTSWMWPVPIHGSLVIITSPGFSVCAGKTFRKCLTVAGRLPMNEAIDIADCAIERPSRVGQHDREIVRLAHQHRERRAHERGRGLVDHADEALPLDFQRDRVEFRVLRARLIRIP